MNYEYDWKIKSGIGCLIFGYHNFIFHPLTLYLSYIDRYKKLPSFEWVLCFIFHDVGYAFIDMKNIRDGKENHPIYGAYIIKTLIGDYWADICIRHSREFCNNENVSDLAYIDKDSTRFHPIEFAIIQCFISGELGTRNINEIKNRILNWKDKAEIFVNEYYK